VDPGRRLEFPVKYWVSATGKFPVVEEDDMWRKTINESSEPLVGCLGRKPFRHSEGIAYKPHCGEVGMRRRVGRMGSVKRRGPGHYNPVGARTPGVERRTARMEVLRRPYRP